MYSIETKEGNKYQSVDVREVRKKQLKELKIIIKYYYARIDE